MSMTPIEQRRLLLHDILCSIEGVAKVYFQPPHSSKLVYPCIIYSLNNLKSKHADDSRYLCWPSYTLTLIDYDPDSMLQQAVLDLEKPCYVSFDRFFVSDNLNHWVYDLTFTKK